VIKPLLVAALALLLAACSPEAGRVRSGGPGADTGNRGDQVQLHPGNEGFYGTPNLNPRVTVPKK